eukprot:scaffold19.g1825.t1
MGRGSRHSKNAGIMGSEALTYNERRALGHGTVTERLGKDSLGSFYDCRLTLAPAVDPVCCPSGYLFSREAILENLLEQKKANKRKLAAWQAQQAEEARKQQEKEAIDREAALLAFDRQNHMGASESLAARLKETISEASGGGGTLPKNHDEIMREAEALLAEKRTAASAVNIKQNEDRMKARGELPAWSSARLLGEMRAFWLPSKTPEARALLDKPSMETLCPASGKPLKLRDLVSVRFTPVPGGGPTEYMDPITRDPFTNASRLVVLKTTGDVFLKETWEKCVLPDGHYGGAPVAEGDVMELQRGGTGFAEHDAALQIKKRFLLGPGSGLADLRGQHASAPSKFGLRQWN